MHVDRKGNITDNKRDNRPTPSPPKEKKYQKGTITVFVRQVQGGQEELDSDKIVPCFV